MSVDLSESIIINDCASDDLVCHYNKQDQVLDNFDEMDYYSVMFDPVKSSQKKRMENYVNRFVILNSLQTCTTPKDKQFYRDVEFLTSRIACLEVPEGKIINLADGTYRCAKTFIGGGAYVYYFEDVQNKLPSKLVCRGTSVGFNVKESFNSVINDLLPEMGSMGVKAIWPQLSEFLLQNKIKTVDVYGMSLGGNHAQTLSVFIEGLLGVEINRLVTLASCGVPATVHKLFQEVLGRRKDKPFNIEVIRQGGDEKGHNIDLTPFVGGEHLGLDDRCNVKVSYIYPGKEITVSGLSKLMCKPLLFFYSLKGPHIRQTTIRDFSINVVKDNEKYEHLTFGTIAEIFRQAIAFIVGKLFGDGVSLDAFYNNIAASSKSIKLLPN